MSGTRHVRRPRSHRRPMPIDRSIKALTHGCHACDLQDLTSRGVVAPERAPEFGAYLGRSPGVMSGQQRRTPVSLSPQVTRAIEGIFIFAGQRHFRGGQGRGRTADLPISADYGYGSGKPLTWADARRRRTGGRLWRAFGADSRDWSVSVRDCWRLGNAVSECGVCRRFWRSAVAEHIAYAAWYAAGWPAQRGKGPRGRPFARAWTVGNG